MLDVLFFSVLKPIFNFTDFVRFENFRIYNYLELIALLMLIIFIIAIKYQIDFYYDIIDHLNSKRLTVNVDSKFDLDGVMHYLKRRIVYFCMLPLQIFDSRFNLLQICILMTVVDFRFLHNLKELNNLDILLISRLMLSFMSLLTEMIISSY